MTVRRKSAAAFTLIEVMLTTLILLVAVVGTSGYRYYGALDARRSAMRIAAARIGLLLCENWRGFKGTETYDPTTYFSSELTITAITVPDGFVGEGFTTLGGYKVVMDNTNYYAILSWKDVDTGLRALNVVVAWAQREQGATGIADADKLFSLTTYASN